MRIPAHGKSRDEVFSTLEDYRKGDCNWRSGRVWAYVYDPGSEVEAVIKQAYMGFLSENGLDPTAFPSMLRLENELVAMCAGHLKGDAEVAGNFTSGGTESIILAVKTARDRARALRPGITRPEMILPVTAHAAFQKAAHYLDVKPVLTRVDPVTYRADAEAMRAAITQETILMVGSAISYAHGVVDPIEEIGQIALEHDLLFHVDGCMGGFLLPYLRRLGAPVPRFEFDVPGVTSISMDLHKYAFAAKGASVILHKSKELRKYQIYACSTWTGYTIVNPTVQSTKSGGPLAAAWAVLNFVGEEGYLEMARQMLDATRRVIAGIDAIPGLRVLGRPDMNLLAFTSDELSVFELMDEMNSRGWFVQPQLGYENSKENLHLSINPAAGPWVDEFLADLRECAGIVRGKPNPGGELTAMLKGMLADVDVASFDAATFRELLGMAGIEGTNLPKRLAEINSILNALPKDISAELLREFINQLYHQSVEVPV